MPGTFVNSASQATRHFSQNVGDFPGETVVNVSLDNIET
jgi:hypothetical protein